MEKPILEWYEELPEPIRSQAIENYDPEWAEFYEGMAPSNSEAILRGFVWKKTEEKGQGWDYWLDIYNRAEAGEFDAPLTKLHSLIAKLEERQEQFEKMI